MAVQKRTKSILFSEKNVITIIIIIVITIIETRKGFTTHDRRKTTHNTGHEKLTVQGN